MAEAIQYRPDRVAQLNGNRALDPFALQARIYPRVLRVARASADLAASEEITMRIWPSAIPQ